MLLLRFILFAILFYFVIKWVLRWLLMRNGSSSGRNQRRADGQSGYSKLTDQEIEDVDFEEIDTEEDQ